jgi:hypothetical protein
MWVFSDAGTSADGERLYAFTHRTFMEYFAAWNLAATSDTPEDLADELGTLVRSVSWHVVGELAVKIKSNISDRGADRVYGALLDRAAAELGDSGEVLAFLAKCIVSTRPSPANVRRLTHVILDYLFSGHVLEIWSTVEDNSIGAQPASLLINQSGSYYTIVDAEIGGRLAEMITSGDTHTKRDALQFIAEIAWGSQPSPAGQWAIHQLSLYPTEIIAESATDIRLRISALFLNLITSRQVLAMPGGFNSLLRRIPMKFSHFESPAWLYFWSGLSDAPGATEELTKAGQYLIDHPALPWAQIRATDLRSADYPFGPIRIRNPLDETSGLAISAVVAIICEARQEDRTNSKVFDYPIPTQFREIFTQWAAGEVDLMEIIEE